VEFLIVGGEAVIFYGNARYTGDIDVFYRITPENVQRLFQALCDFWGESLPGLSSPADLQEPERIVQFGLPPWRIDVMNDIDGVSFDQAWADSVEAEVAGSGAPFRVRYIGLDSLIRNKAAAGRSKDMEDLRFLESLRRRRESE